MRNLILFHENRLSRGRINLNNKVYTLFNSNTINFIIFNLLKEKWQSHLLQIHLFQNQIFFDNLDNTCVILENYKLSNLKCFLTNIKSKFGEYYKFKKIFCYFCGIDKLNNIYQTDKKLVKYFFFWNSLNKKEIIRKKLQLLNIKNKKLILKEIDKNFEFRNLLSIVKLNISCNVSFSISKIFSKAISKSDNKLFTHNFLSFENTYNNYLLQKIKSVFIISSLIEKRKKFVTNIHLNKNYGHNFESKNFIINGTKDYFSLWKLKCKKLILEQNKLDTLYKGLNIIFKFIENKYWRNLKYLVFNNLKYSGRQAFLNQISILTKTEFIFLFMNNLVKKKVIFNDKIIYSITNK
jgi:hypothetical protein